MIIRAEPKDAKVLSELACSTFYDTFTGTCTEQDMQQFLEHYYNVPQMQTELQDEANFFYIYWQNDIAVGYVKFGADNSGFEELKKYKSVELKRLYIEKEYHGRGVAQALMNIFMQFATEQHYEVAWLGVWEFNYKAQHFYKKYGFENSGFSHPFPIGSTPQTDLWFWKKL